MKVALYESSTGDLQCIFTESVGANSQMTRVSEWTEVYLRRRPGPEIRMERAAKIREEQHRLQVRISALESESVQ